MAQSKEERISQLYTALENPGLDGAAARLYMSEYLYLTGNHHEDGAWLFLTKDQVAGIASQLRFRERLMAVRFVAALSLGIMAATYVFTRSLTFKKPDPVQERLDYLLDKDLIGTYSTEEFKVVMAEASALLASKAMGLLSEEELLRVQAEICDPSPETEDIQKG